MTTYTMSQEAIATLTKLVKQRYEARDGEFAPEAVFLIYGYLTDDGIIIDRFNECPNAHEDPLYYFGVRKTDAQAITTILQGVNPGIELVGVMHTHEAAGDDGPSWEDIDTARHGTINAVLCVYDRSVSFYDERGFITKFRLYRRKLRLIDNEVVTSDTHIAQYPFPTADK